MPLEIIWSVGSLTADQVTFLNRGALFMGFTGDPITIDDDNTHPIFAFITQNFVEQFTSYVDRQIDKENAARLESEKDASHAVAETIG